MTAVRYFISRIVLPIRERNSASGNSEACVDSEKNGARLASKHDSRITPVDMFCVTCIADELPQLFNVFMGDMSLVGPRPERDVIMQEYEQEIPEFHYRLKVKPD